MTELEEELDLRRYFLAIWYFRYWIVGATILATFSSFIIITLQPKTYKTTALITVLNPQTVELESLTDETLDPRFQTVSKQDPLINAYPELALSDEVLQQLLIQIEPQIAEINSIDDLREILGTEKGEAPALLKLVVYYPDNVQAALIANAWAELFVPWANELLGQQSTQRLRILEDQLHEAELAFETTENVFIEFQGINQFPVLSNELTSTIEAQVEYLNELRRTEFLLQDAQNLRAQIAAQQNVSAVTFIDQLTLLNLQLRTFNAEATSVDLQVSTNDILLEESKTTQVALLDRLIETLEHNIDLIDLRLTEIEAKILTLQQASQAAELENGRLLRNRALADEEYTALTRMVIEERISTQDLQGGVQLVSRSAVPRFPESKGRLLKTAIAGAVTFFGIIFLIIALTWWQQLSKENAEVS